MDVDYKIVNVYKSLTTTLRSLGLPVLPRPCLNAGDFNCRHVDWDYDDNSPVGECLAGWASIYSLALLYNAKDVYPLQSVFLKSFPGHNIYLWLSHNQGLLCHFQACLLNDGTFAKPNGINERLCRHLIHLM